MVVGNPRHLGVFPVHLGDTYIWTRWGKSNHELTSLCKILHAFAKVRTTSKLSDEVDNRKPFPLLQGTHHVPPWGEKCNQRYHLWMTRSFSSRFCFLIPSPLKRAQKVKNTKLQRKKISMKDEKRRRYNSSTEMPGPWGDPMGVDGEHWDRKRETVWGNQLYDQCLRRNVDDRNFSYPTVLAHWTY